ncbi:MAG TPA: prepilin-type N-terminal cleavage/methylation domain-containing protein [Candidatus Ozemobacteraceae bacterium]|nr:prepilin-type N-terminal cleavage/methylation domain-containing protein [Candidatus Ozemobacteraceae bacterium]
MPMHPVPAARKRRGVTLLEILSAMLILAFAFIPIFGVISTGTADSDITNSYISAQTIARNVLDTALDSVPFESIQVNTGQIADIGESNDESNVGLMVDVPGYDERTFLAQLGNNTTADMSTRGEIIDERGIRYKVKLFVFPIAGNAPLNIANDVSFRYRPRPLYENAVNAQNQQIWYTTNPGNLYMNSAAQSPYSYPLPAPVIQSARELGAPAGPSGDYCVMKRLLLRVKWQMPRGIERSVTIYTAKAHLSRQD